MECQMFTPCTSHNRCEVVVTKEFILLTRSIFRCYVTFRQCTRRSSVNGILYTCLNCPVQVGTPLRVPPHHGTMVGLSKSQHKWQTLKKHDSHKSMLVKPSENHSTGQHKTYGNLLLPEGGHKENMCGNYNHVRWLFLNSNRPLWVGVWRSCSLLWLWSTSPPK